MKWMNKLERKFGKYAISNLMYYIIILYGICLLFNIYNKFSLTGSKIVALHLREKNFKKILTNCEKRVDRVDAVCYNAYIKQNSRIKE